MPVPKKRLGASDQGHRRSCWKANTPTISICRNCGQPHLAHNACLSCGYYDGKFVSEKLLKRKATFSN